VEILIAGVSTGGPRVIPHVPSPVLHLKLGDSTIAGVVVVMVVGAAIVDAPTVT